MTQGLRIAVADDESVMRNYFQKMLPRMGHAVVGAAANGRELVDLCLSTRPDLVITDMRMAEQDGMSAAREIYTASAVPIILVSAHHDVDLLEKAEAHHIMEYLVKPIKQADLESAIATAMRRFWDLSGKLP